MAVAVKNAHLAVTTATTIVINPFGFKITGPDGMPVGTFLFTALIVPRLAKNRLMPIFD